MKFCVFFTILQKVYYCIILNNEMTVFVSGVVSDIGVV